MKNLWTKWTGIALVKRILVGLILGAILGVAAPGATSIAILGDVFVGALKAIAPPSGILPGYQFTVQRRKIPRRRHQNSGCALYVQYCSGSCDRCICQHDLPGTDDADQCGS